MEFIFHRLGLKVLETSSIRENYRKMLSGGNEFCLCRIGRMKRSPTKKLRQKKNILDSSEEDEVEISSDGSEFAPFKGDSSGKYPVAFIGLSFVKSRTQEDVWVRYLRTTSFSRSGLHSPDQVTELLGFFRPLSLSCSREGDVSNRTYPHSTVPTHRCCSDKEIQLRRFRRSQHG